MAKVAQRIKQKSFKDWLYEEVCDEFGLTEILSHPEIEKLKTIKLPINDTRKDSIEELRLLLQLYINSWSETHYQSSRCAKGGVAVDGLDFAL